MADNRISDLVGKLWSGEISRRTFIARAAAAGIGAPAVTAALTQGAMAAPSSKPGLRNSLNQADATTLVIADVLNGQDWLHMDPGWFYEINSSQCINLVYECLYDIPDGTKTSEIRPLLAEALPEYSEDGLTATVKLRQGVKFQTSGNEFTSADVVFSFNRLKNIGFQASFLASDYWTEVTGVDDYTVQFKMETPNAALAAILTATMLSITDGKRIVEMGGTDATPTGDDPGTSPEVAANEAARDAITNDSVGTGPFKMASWNRDSEIVIDVNPDYWGESPALQQVIWRNVNEANAQVQLVQTGEADISYSLPVDLVESVASDPNLQVIEGATLAIEYLAMNVREERGGPLAIKEVRQAIGYGIDYDGIVNSILGGAGVRPATPVPLPLTGSEAVESKKYVLDLAKAQELWDASGVGEQEIEITYDSDSPAQGGANLESIAVKVKSDLEQINGLTIKLAPMPGAERIGAYRAGDFQATLSPWTPDYPDVDTYAGPFGRTDTAAAGRVGYSDPEMDTLLDQALAELDPTKREALYVQIQEKMIDAAAFIVLYQPVDRKAARAVVQGATVHPVYQIQLRGVSKTA
jgi:peptide/nickel transport system substrate-binding protein